MSGNLLLQLVWGVKECKILQEIPFLTKKSKKDENNFGK